MNTYKKLSNSFLVYGFVFFSMFIFIAGITLVFKFVQEASQTGIPAALMEQIVSIGLGVICLSLAAPCYRLLTSLKILHLKSSQTGTPTLIPYTPFFISDMLEADEVTCLNPDRVRNPVRVYPELKIVAGKTSYLYET